MLEMNLSVAIRLSVTLSSAALVLVMYRVLGGSQGTTEDGGPPRGGLAVVLGSAFAVAAAFTHLAPLRAQLHIVFPLGVALGLGGACWSLASARARASFDRLSDSDVRLLLAWRAPFGALILALGASGHMPSTFALTAGLGDLAVGWIALAAPFSLGARGPRMGRLIVHGLGLLDLVHAITLAVLVVRPWALAHGNAADTMTLPWVAVPLMFAVNAHGLRQAWLSPQTEPARDRPQPPGGVRSVVSGT